MHVEPTGSYIQVQPPASKCCPACKQVRASTDFSTTASGISSYCQDCQRAASRLASCRRAAAMRLLLAAHPEEWADLLSLVRGRGQAATTYPKGGGRDG